MKFFKYFSIALLAFSTSSLANNELIQKLAQAMPGTPITDAQRVVGIPGLVEVTVGKNRILYTNEDGSKILIGHLYDPATQTDLTQEKINRLSKISWSELPFDTALTITKGDGSREFAVFTDIDCPFCQRLENELANVTNYKMHVFFYPLKQSGRSITESIWCSSDKAKSFHDYMTQRIKPTNAANCDVSAIEKSFRFAQEVGITGTPTLIGKSSGDMKPGFMPAPQLENWLNQNGR